MSREAVIGPVKRTDRLTFPMVAIREAISNAIVHEDYSHHGSSIRVVLPNSRPRGVGTFVEAHRMSSRQITATAYLELLVSASGFQQTARILALRSRTRMR
jgi:hypothetical protein